MITIENIWLFGSYFFVLFDTLNLFAYLEYLICFVKEFVFCFALQKRDRDSRFFHVMLRNPNSTRITRTPCIGPTNANLLLPDVDSQEKEKNKEKMVKSLCSTLLNKLVSKIIKKCLFSILSYLSSFLIASNVRHQA